MQFVGQYFHKYFKTLNRQLTSSTHISHTHIYIHSYEYSKIVY